MVPTGPRTARPDDKLRTKPQPRNCASGNLVIPDRRLAPSRMTKRIPLLFRQQRECAIPVFRRRRLLIAADACFIEIVEQVERARLVSVTAALDSRERANPIAAAIAGQHLDGEVAQP